MNSGISATEKVAAATTIGARNRSGPLVARTNGALSSRYADRLLFVQRNRHAHEGGVDDHEGSQADQYRRQLTARERVRRADAAHR